MAIRRCALLGAQCPRLVCVSRCRYTEAKLARFYRLALPDTESTEGVTSAPQTLTTELALLSDELVHHVGHLISPVMNIAYLSVVLRRSLGAAPLLCYLGYFCVATALIEKVKRGSARACGGTLAAAIAEGQQLESELRERCSKVHNNREEIAMLRGECLSSCELAAMHDVRSVLLCPVVRLFQDVPNWCRRKERGPRDQRPFLLATSPPLHAVGGARCG